MVRNDVPALEVRGLTRTFGSVTAIAGVDLVVARGEVLGLLGPRGAGKSTLLRLCCGLLAPGDGTVRVCGHDVWRDRRRALARLVYLPEESIAYPYLTGREFLRLMADLYGLPRGRRRQDWIDELCAWLAVGPELDALIGTCPYGARKKIELVSLLLREPAVLFLDEPTSGLDPSGAQRVVEVLRDVAGRGRTVVLATHEPQVARALCDRVAILEAGRLVALRPAAGEPAPGVERSPQPAGAVP